ncbi:hypothetical protein ABAC460_09760 [Asticcacaulis sp. AC460]|uniref:hypothetical protein n=1 Tax=Asticcacaulis sp. AC460 TaxID=1282360 RepID=UPI0003C3C540|nr:hypothetical protein [Asticcacaulis sp. AC460]ESQ90043.1 hypothetical protein ABAC460_09760 [Asticcacaulis sp. AC460]
MKRLWVLGLLATVAACSTKPVPPVTVQPPPPPQSGPKAVEARLYDDEAAALKAYPKFARREGDKLVLSYDGRDIVRLTSTPESACEGWETCSLWSFAGLIQLKDGPVAVVYREHGEGDNYILFDRSGKSQWLAGAPMASPGGRYIASGIMASPLSDGLIEIVDWHASPRAIVDSDSWCEPVAWRDALRLKLRCNRDGENQAPAFEAEAVLTGNAWQLTSAQPVLPFKPRPPQTAQERAESHTWEKDVGIERLP